MSKSKGIPQTIFFDVGHTLVTGADQSPRRLLGSRLGLSEKETRKIGQLIMTHPSEELTSLVKAISDTLPGKDADQISSVIEMVWQEQISCVREISGATILLKALKEQGHKLGVISNIWHPFYQGFCQTCSEMARLLDYRILSYRAGFKKPSYNLY